MVAKYYKELGLPGLKISIHLIYSIHEGLRHDLHNELMILGGITLLFLLYALVVGP